MTLDAEWLEIYDSVCDNGPWSKWLKGARENINIWKDICHSHGSEWSWLWISDGDESSKSLSLTESELCQAWVESYLCLLLIDHLKCIDILLGRKVSAGWGLGMGCISCLAQLAQPEMAISQPDVKRASGDGLMVLSLPPASYLKHDALLPHY